MKRLLLLFFGVTAFYLLPAQKTINDANVEKRTVTGFHGIDVSTGIHLIITEGTTEDVAVSASKTEYRDKIITKVENGILKIYYKSEMGAINRKDGDKKLKAYVSYKKLDKLDVNTGAEVKIEGVLNSPSLELDANTGGSVDGEINITNLDVDQHTGSKITLTGKAETLDVEGHTGSKFLGEDLKAMKCTAEVNTGARIFISVQNELNAKAHTGGNIKYKGTAGVKNIKTHTGGSISKI